MPVHRPEERAAGIAANLLSDRIRERESAGLIRREDAPPPIATTLFHLTKAGAVLSPVLDAIGRWGIRYMIEPAEGDEFRGHWFTFPVLVFLHDRDPDGPPVSIELRTASGPAVIEISEGSDHGLGRPVEAHQGTYPQDPRARAHRPAPFCLTPTTLPGPSRPAVIPVTSTRVHSR